MVTVVYIHPSPLGTDAAPLFHGESAFEDRGQKTRRETLDTDEGSTEGDCSLDLRRSILLVRREPPPSLTFLSTLLPSLAGGGRLERRSRLWAAGHTEEGGRKRKPDVDGGKKKKKRKRKDLSKESLRINRGWICLLLFLGNV